MAPLIPNPPLWREGRIGLELVSLVRDPVFHGEGVSDGNGQPVMLIPGLLAGDGSLSVMARWLKGTGHRPTRAAIRSNVSCSTKAVERLEYRLEQVVEREGQRAAIIGHSRGGHFAKVLAHRRPDLVSGIVALGSPQVKPLAVHPVVLGTILTIGALGTARVPGMFSASCLMDRCCDDFWAHCEDRLPRGIGYVSIYSRSDGVVKWRSCLDEQAEHVEVRASHCGMAVHPEVYRTIADSLKGFRRRDARRKPITELATVTPLRRAA